MWCEISTYFSLHLCADAFQNTNKKLIISLENGHNPIWNESCEFIVKNPNFAMLRFEVQDEDMFGEPNFIGQAVFPVSMTIHG